MSTTYAAWINSLEALTVSGVVRKYTSGPPLALSTADLPAQWCSLPRGQESGLSFCNWGGSITRTVDFIVALEAVAQNNQGPNFDATVAMIDAIDTALRAMTQVNSGALSWRPRMVIVNVAGTDYWAVVCEVIGEDLI